MKWKSPLILLLLGMVLFGSATPVSKLVIRHLPLFTASLARAVLGTLALLPFTWILLPQVKGFSLRQWLILFIISGLGMVGFTFFLLKGMSLVSGVTGSIFVALSPVATLLGARIFLGSRLTKLRILAIGFATLGAFSLYFFKDSFQTGSDSQLYLGGAFLLGAVCCEAAYSLVGKAAIKTMNPVLVVFLATFFSIPFFFLLSLLEPNSWQKLMDLKASSLFELIWWGAGTLALGSACWYEGMSKTNVGDASAYMGVMPLTSLVLSYVLLDETFHWAHLIGFSCVFLAALLIGCVQRENHSS